MGVKTVRTVRDDIDGKEYTESQVRDGNQQFLEIQVRVLQFDNRTLTAKAPQYGNPAAFTILTTRENAIKNGFHPRYSKEDPPAPKNPAQARFEALQKAIQDLGFPTYDEVDDAISAALSNR